MSLASILPFLKYSDSRKLAFIKVKGLEMTEEVKKLVNG